MTNQQTKPVALITGATSGIGEAAARIFAEQGYNLVLAARRKEAGEQVAQSARQAGADAIFVATDVASEAQIQTLVEQGMARFGRLDVAFNNAGMEGEMGLNTAELTFDAYREMFDTNVAGVAFGMKHQIQAMLQSGGGSIINTASIFSKIGMPGMALYNASKHAVVGLTQTAALEYAQQGIRVNAISPGGVETEMFQRAAGTLEENSEGRQFFTNFHPMGRISTPEEQAHLVAFLASSKASFINGVNYSVDSGWSIS